MPVVMGEGLCPRRYVSTVLVGHPVGNARGIASFMVVATTHHGARQTRHRHLMQPTMDSHRGSRLQPRLSAQVKPECNPGSVSIFLAAKEVIGILLKVGGPKAPGGRLCRLLHSPDKNPPPIRDPQCLPPAPGSAATVFYQPFLNRYGRPLRGAS